MNVVHPYYLVHGDLQAMEQRFDPDTREEGLTGDTVYLEGELVQFVSGKVRKSVQTTPASLTPLFLAGADYEQPFGIERGDAKSRVLTDVPLNAIPKDNYFVMTYQGNTANGTPHVFTTANRQAVLAGMSREIVFNTTEKCFTIRDGTTNPNVQLIGIFKGAVDDENVRVIVRILPGFLGS